MPELKPSTVLLLLAVVVVVALYVLGVGLGATDPSEGRRRPAVTAEQRQAWRERFIKPRPVNADELKLAQGAPCTLAGQEVSVTLGQPCRLEVEEGGARGRTLEVVPQASLVALTFTPKSKPALVVTEDATANAKKLDVMKEGASLELRCVRGLTGSAALCRVRLQ
jgi:hypothetical protein